MKFLFSGQNQDLQFKDFISAHERIRAHLQPTPISFSHSYSDVDGKKVILKLDNKLRTGSFKERGAVNFLSSLSDKEKSKGVFAASAGNHALALSHHAARLGIKCTLIMPLNAPLVKVQSSQKNGARVIQAGETFAQSYEEAQKLCRREKSIFVSPFDDLRIIAGQGSCALEILEQVEDFDSIIVPVGGGGLISGIASVIKERKPDVFILGVQSDWAVEARGGKHKDTGLLRPATIADGIAVKQIGELTAPLIASKVDKVITVSENEIAKAVTGFLEKERTVIEGAAAAAVAALKKDALPDRCRSTVVVISGSNIDMNVLSRLLERDMAEKGRLLKVCVSVPDRPGSLHATSGIIASCGANVLQVLHDRSFSKIPGNVEITLLLEVRDHTHKTQVLEGIKKAGLEVQEIP